MRVSPFAIALRRIVSRAIAAAAVGIAVAGGAFAQDYPTRSVRLIVAFTPGGTTDITARLIADKMHDTLGAVVAAVGKAAINSPMLVVSADMKANSARELADLARRKPGAITIGITGRGAMSDLGLQLFEASAGIQLQSVPYRGAAQAITDILGGHLDGLVGDVPTVMAQVQAGRLKALATTSKERSDIFPRVATFAEQGFADAVGDNWAGVLAPAGAPVPAIAKFNAAMVAALNDPELRERLREAGTTPAPSSPEEFGNYLREEIAHWKSVIKEKGLKGE